MPAIATIAFDVYLCFLITLKDFSPAERSVQVFIDSYFLNETGLISVHPNENTATVLLKTEDLLQIIKEHGNAVDVVSI